MLHKIATGYVLKKRLLNLFTTPPLFINALLSNAFFSLKLTTQRIVMSLTYALIVDNFSTQKMNV